MKQFAKALLANCFILASSLVYSSTVKMEATCSSEHLLTFSYGIISQKRELFITTIVRTSNPMLFYTEFSYTFKHTDCASATGAASQKHCYNWVGSVYFWLLHLIQSKSH
jgi:hypothetical protein